ncbi:MAG: MBOAT family O-acyltransferase [Arenicella sp.]
MLFSSYQFVYFFLPAFLICFLLALRFSSRSNLEWVILCFSGLFYSIYSLEYTFILAFSIGANFYLALFISQRARSSAKSLLTIGVALNLLSIAYFKYANFFLDNIRFVIEGLPVLEILLPLGISFFTFQQIAYLVDVYKHGAAESNIKRYAIFVSFFPQLVAGPIVHHKTFLSQLRQNFSDKWNLNYLFCGLSIFFIGLFKKVVIADSLSNLSDIVFTAADAGNTMVFIESWIGAFSYAFQIYFDFSGYSDMAIGMALAIGLWLPINFNSPYKAVSIIDFWRRWHITLSSFLKDYVYIPLGGNRLGSFVRFRNLMIVMLVGGLWHGAGWTFVVWGGLHGLFLTVNHIWRKTRFKHYRSNYIYIALSWMLTMLSVVIAWVFFRAETFSGALDMVRSMFLLSQDYKVIIPYSVDHLIAADSALKSFFTPGLIMQNLYILDGYWVYAKVAVILCLLLVICLPNTLQIFARFFNEKLGGDPYGLSKSYFSWSMNAIWGLLLGLFIVMSLVMLSETTEFIYFEF